MCPLRFLFSSIIVHHNSSDAGTTHKFSDLFETHCNTHIHQSVKMKAAFQSLLTFTSLALLPECHASTVPSLSGTSIDITSGKNGTYPRATILSDSSILASYASTLSNGNKQLTLSKSSDQGKTWSNIGTAATRNASTSDLDNAFPIQLRSGRILLAYRNHDVDPETKLATYFRITISYSDDEGIDWNYLSTPAENVACPSPNKCGIWEPFLRVAKDGSTLQLYYSKENSDVDQDSLMRSSSDGGETWSEAKTISGENVTARDGMVGVSEVGGDGKLIAVFETTEDGNFLIDEVVSEDDGGTWEARRRVYTPTGENTNAGAPQVVNLGGNLVVSFMTDEDTQQDNWVQGAAAKLVTSGDGGETWSNNFQVSEPQANWPGMLTLDDDSFLYLVDHLGAKAQKVVLS
ncbi:hypothetical protein AC579_2316 [Pseudocercospora musae]|uniref:Sialidase domain-containing protein n=1 Tax=Pseudocercospora musae TaxID=113226 RepID=A0A139I7Q9_9PEZI|nr:hypothetical protein AC579_2316 [Pseudocercospora musae]